MTQRSIAPIACLLPVVSFACIQVAPVPRTASLGTATLEVRDWLDEASDPQTLPRRPRFDVRAPQGFARAKDSLLLFEGAVDAALIADLSHGPLSGDHEARLVPSELAFTQEGAVLSPRSALSAGASYTLAVPGWARSSRGRPLSATSAPMTFRLRTAAGPEAGARVASSWPADGATNVGTNLKAALIAFDGLVQDAADGAWLESPDGLALAAEVYGGPCASVAPDQIGTFCLQIAPKTRLAPNTRYAVVLGTRARDAHRAPVGPWRAIFNTGSGADPEPPALLPLQCAVDEQSTELGCALIADTSVALRIQADEAAIAVLQIGTARASAVSPGGQAVLRVSGLEPDSALTIQLSLRDSSGNQADHSLSVRTLPALATISISQVRADPIGAEPQQELVELFNYGTQPVDLRGFVLEDRADATGDPIARSFLVAPQTRVLLVADDFDPLDARDAMPPPGAPLVRVGRAIAGAGLSNSGAPLFLRDSQGHRVSAAPATPRPRPGVCLTRTSSDMRDGSPESFDYDANDTCTF